MVMLSKHLLTLLLPLSLRDSPHQSGIPSPPSPGLSRLTVVSALPGGQCKVTASHTISPTLCFPSQISLLPLLTAATTPQGLFLNRRHYVWLARRTWKESVKEST